MTKQTINPIQEQSSLEERIEIISKELELAIRWQRPCVIFAVYSSEYVRADVQAALENYLMDLGQDTLHIQCQTEHPKNVTHMIEANKPYENLIFFIDNLSLGQSDGANTYLPLYVRREFFNENNLRAIFWLTHKEIVELSRYASDFWTYRDCAVEFVDAPKIEQILGQELEAAWQGTGEYSDRFEDTEDKISLRETLLTALPKHDESTSTRANMLLTLGILNWRKGDFEKANEQLERALKLAIQIQDSWFEAECCNAIALLRSSMGLHEEAIEAYKQAIHLAPGQIFAWNNLGNLCAKIGRNDEALVTFIKALECNSHDPIAWNGLGNVYQKLGYVDDSIAAYRKSIKYMSSFANPWNGLGDAYASVGRNEEAIKVYQQAAQLNSRYVTPWLNLGSLFAKLGRQREALKALQCATSLDPRNSSIWNEIGLVYLKDNALDEAAEAFSKAIEIDRADGWAHSNLGMVYSQQEKHAESLPLFLRSVELLKEDKDKAVSWNRLGDAYRQVNEYDKAVQAYEMADRLEHGIFIPSEAKPDPSPVLSMDAKNVEISPEMQVDENISPTPILEVEAEIPTEITAAESFTIEAVENNEDIAAPSWVFESRDGKMNVGEDINDPAPTTENDQTLSSLAQKLQVAKASTDSLAEAMTWNDKGNESFRKGDFESAINAYNLAVQLDPSLGWPYSNLAQIYVMQNQFAEAILLYQKSIDLLDSNKDKAICWNGLGNVYRRLNDYDNAIAAYQKAAELDPETGGLREGAGSGKSEQTPKDSATWNDLGEAFLKSGSYKEAVAALKKAIDLNPRLALTHGNLALALTYLGKHAEAIPLYKKAIEMIPSNKDKAVWLNRLGNAYRKLNDYDNAISSFREALALSDEGANLVSRVRFSLLSNCCAD